MSTSSLAHRGQTTPSAVGSPERSHPLSSAASAPSQSTRLPTTEGSTGGAAPRHMHQHVAMPTQLYQHLNTPLSTLGEQTRRQPMPLPSRKAVRFTSVIRVIVSLVAQFVSKPLTARQISPLRPSVRLGLLGAAAALRSHFRVRAAVALHCRQQKPPTPSRRLGARHFAARRRRRWKHGDALTAAEDGRPEPSF